MIRPLSDGAGSIGQWLQTESGLKTHFTPFFTFALELVVPGTRGFTACSIVDRRVMPGSRRFPPPWIVEETAP